MLGYDLDYLEEIFGPIQANFTFELIPWNRCLHEVETGDAYDMLSSAAFSQERDEKYLVTDSYYTVRPHYFYPKRRFPDGLEIADIEQFANYRVCGLHGYSYSIFGISEKSIDSGTHNFSQLIEKTERGRCDVFLGRYEIFAGFAKTGNNYIVKHSLGTAPMPGIPGDKFHMMVSRNYPHAEALRDTINEGIARLKSSGADRELLAPYLD